MTPDDARHVAPGCLPTTRWFMASESGKPLGQTHGPEPSAGGIVAGPGELAGWVIVSVTELRATCAVRRFRVVVRPPG